MPSDPGKKPPKIAITEAQPLEEQIRCRAYELYEERGREDGHDFDDWLRAEELVTQPKARTIAA